MSSENIEFIAKVIFPVIASLVLIGISIGNSYRSAKELKIKLFEKRFEYIIELQNKMASIKEGIGFIINKYPEIPRELFTEKLGPNNTVIFPDCDKIKDDGSVRKNELDDIKIKLMNFSREFHNEIQTLQMKGKYLYNDKKGMELFWFLNTFLHFFESGFKAHSENQLREATREIYTYLVLFEHRLFEILKDETQIGF